MKSTITLVLVVTLGLLTASTPPCESPVNDDPCITSSNPPLDLSGGGSHAGTTCCARGFNDPDNGEDQRNVDCNRTTAVEVYWGQPDAGCMQGIFIEKILSNCGPLPFSGKIGNCPPADGDVLFIKIASTDPVCEAFDISLSEV